MRWRKKSLWTVTSENPPLLVRDSGMIGEDPTLVIGGLWTMGENRPQKTNPCSTMTEERLQ